MEQITGIVGALTGLVSMVLSLGIAFWAIYWNYQKKRLQYHERQLMIEKGMTPPPVLPEQGRKKVTPQDCLRRGTVLLFLGIGLGAAGLIVINAGFGEEELGGILGVAGAIVGFLGAGYLAYYFMVRHNPPEDETRPIET